MKGIIISNINNKLIFKTKGGKKIKWTFIPHINVGDEIFFFTNTKGKIIKIEPIQCKHYAEEPKKLYENDIIDINLSELYHEHE